MPAAEPSAVSPAQLQSSCMRLLGSITEAVLALGGQLQSSFSNAAWLWCK